MAKITGEEHSGNPPIPQSGSPGEEIISIKDAGTNHPNQETTQNMEVHQHSHSHGKKNWKSYIWEFLMLFLAVFCGFLAEYKLEHTIEHQREKEYILSMIEDAKTDTANLQKNITLNIFRAKHLDTLAILCLNYDESGKNDEEIHKLFKYALYHPFIVSPTERTIQQLKNAGGMRLIRKKVAIDSIILYDDMNKKLANQQTYYELYLNKSIEIGAKIMNFQHLGFRKYPTNSTYLLAIDSSKKLINRDKLKLIELGNMIDMFQGVVEFYTVRLEEMNQHAIHLIETLRKEYHLENE